MDSGVSPFLPLCGLGSKLLGFLRVAFGFGSLCLRGEFLDFGGELRGPCLCRRVGTSPLCVGCIADSFFQGSDLVFKFADLAAGDVADGFPFVL